MSNWGDDSIYGQATKEGGIVDNFIDDISDEPNKKKGKKNLVPKGRMRYCPRCGERLSSMKPR